MTFLPKVPYAFLPSINQETNYNDDDNNVSMKVIFFGNKYYKWNNILYSTEGAWCVGSSNNFLMFLDNKGRPFLINPFSNTFIGVPPFTDSFIRGANIPSYSYYVQYLRNTFVSKVAVMSFPSPLKYTIAIMYDYPCKISFSNNKSTSWVELCELKRSYFDIVFDNNILYALDEDGFIEGWNFCHQEVPKRIFEVNHPTMVIDNEEEKKFPFDKFSTKFYLVKSKKQFLLIERFIGNFVNTKDLLNMCSNTS
ncbi:uncharacterized protein LOC131605107 [Vicia villosa]|uniref:uncharacterized protein LOC131605107 n=1 Tax=Vicia villosa TaxID=3911 RepID=UPI00273C88C5|nr:uncharacterized protein LOC131605107 [Vicia villosa]